ncbi:MAG: hypothetical protein RLZZ301_747 [Bacteroidota bacterium]|jgi:RNA polymerase sigma-70 factor (ECF subfamily)
MSTETDLYSALIKACIAQEPKAQRRLYDQFSGAMYQICLRYAKDSDEAQDIFQDAFVKVFGNLQKITNPHQLPGWIKRVFIHTAIDHLRVQARNQRNSSIDGAFHLEDPNVHILEELSKNEIMGLVQKLPPRARMVFNLYVMEGYPHQEIAQLMNITEGTSKSQLFEAKQQLKRALLKQEQQYLRLIS